VTQSGADIAKFQTPHTQSVRRSSNPLIIACSKPGYHQTRALVTTTISDGAWGNLVVGGIIGVMVDQSSGAAYRYYDPPKLSLIPAGEPPPDASRVIAKGVTLLPPSAGPTPAARPAETPVSATPIAAAPPRRSGTLPAAGIWECGLKSANRYYKLQFVVAADHSMVVTTYDNAPVTVVSKDPLTVTALNPRGTRVMNIVWNADNTMVVTGPNTSNPDSTFRNEGACTKV
jgi:hypothetical protein